MPGQAPPAIPPKHANRDALLADADYFATELIRRLERLAKIEGRSVWQQAAALTRRVRGAARHEADQRRHRAKLEARRTR